jgi:hypothetical protein
MKIKNRKNKKDKIKVLILDAWSEAACCQWQTV